MSHKQGGWGAQVVTFRREHWGALRSSPCGSRLTTSESGCSLPLPEKLAPRSMAVRYPALVSHHSRPVWELGQPRTAVQPLREQDGQHPGTWCVESGFPLRWDQSSSPTSLTWWPLSGTWACVEPMPHSGPWPHKAQGAGQSWALGERRGHAHHCPPLPKIWPGLPCLAGL